MEDICTNMYCDNRCIRRPEMPCKLVAIFKTDFNSLDFSKLKKIKDSLPDCVAACDKVLVRLESNTK
jgi:hypothetical protein